MYKNRPTCDQDCLRYDWSSKDVLLCNQNTIPGIICDLPGYGTPCSGKVINIFLKFMIQLDENQDV